MDKIIVNVDNYASAKKTLRRPTITAKTVSPAWCPILSFISLKLSKSIRMIQKVLFFVFVYIYI